MAQLRGDDPHGRVVILGAGLAGLFLALRLAPRPCLVISPAPLGEAAASSWAQGGLAAALSPQDSVEAHAADTIAAGAGLVDPVIAQILAFDGPARVADLLALGVPFDRSENGALRQSLEAAHSFPRVARVSGDLAGQAIMQALVGAVRAASHIEVISGLTAVALLQDGNGRVIGADCRDEHRRRVDLLAGNVVLASGGAGALWRMTTNPRAALGSGLAMAARAGALVADAEFVQFHPTAMDIGADPAPLATEALRGEGACLVDEHGAPFMARFSTQGDLASRDVVARAIHHVRSEGGRAFLDARNAIGAHFPESFPTVFAACMRAGIDPRLIPIPVAPAAHYHMGGLATDLWARTSLEGLSAIGECACTGAHGANRLASNSLLEAVVFAARCAQRLLAEESLGHPSLVPEMLPSVPQIAPDTLLALRTIMEQHVGVVRAAENRAEAIAQIARLRAEHGASNPVLAAGIIAGAAGRRLESRGGHFCPDHPLPIDPPRNSYFTLAQLELA